MNELAAAVQVESMDIDSNAPDAIEQRDRCGTISDAEAASASVEISTADKENNDAQAAAIEVEDAASKVSNAPPITCNARCTQHFT